jgi:hypothetical protein
MAVQDGEFVVSCDPVVPSTPLTLIFASMFVTTIVAKVDGHFELGMRERIEMVDRRFRELVRLSPTQE